MNGNDLNEIKSKNKELQSKVDEYSSYKSQFEEANKKLETYSTFEEKANKYDEIYGKNNKEKAMYFNLSRRT